MVSTRRTAKANNEEPQQLEYFGHGIAAAKYSFNSLSATYKILADSEDGPVRPLKRKRDEEEPAEGQTSKRNKTESDRDGVTEVDTTVKPVRPVKMQSNIDYSKKTVAQLKVLLRKKGMAAGPKDRKNNLIAKLEARDGGESASQTQTVQTEQKSGHGIDHSKKTVAVLRKLLQLRYLSTVGKKAELVARLEANSALYEQGKIKLPVTPQNQITRPCEQWSSSQPPLDSDMSGDDNVVRRSGSLERGLGNNYSPPLFPQHSSPETPSRLPNPARVSSKVIHPQAS